MLQHWEPSYPLVHQVYTGKLSGGAAGNGKCNAQFLIVAKEKELKAVRGIHGG